MLSKKIAVPRQNLCYQNKVLLDPSFIKNKVCVIGYQVLLKTNVLFIQRMIVLLNKKVCFVEQESLFCFIKNQNEVKDRNTFYELFIKPKTNLLLEFQKKINT